jgi:hypothetical protein
MTYRAASAEGMNRAEPATIKRGEAKELNAALKVAEKRLGCSSPSPFRRRQPITFKPGGSIE